MLYVPVGMMPYDNVMGAIELLGTEVVPIVREESSMWETESKGTQGT